VEVLAAKRGKVNDGDKPKQIFNELIGRDTLLRVRADRQVGPAMAPSARPCRTSSRLPLPINNSVFILHPIKRMTRQQIPDEAFCPRSVKNWDTPARFHQLSPQFSIGTEDAYTKQ
jgi:hypothetical protein